MIVCFFSCTQEKDKNPSSCVHYTRQKKINLQTNQLPSWTESKRKNEILTYIALITDSSKKEFIPVEDRIATFDNDGTLWAESPVYFQLFFVLDKIKEKEAEHPAWLNEKPYSYLLKDGIEGFSQMGKEDLMKIMFTSHSNNTTEEFEKEVLSWLKSSKHPVLNRPFTSLVYQPMLELIELLKRNNFKVFIVSGGGIEFMRPWVEEVYGIPKDQVIGSTLKTKYHYNDGKPYIERLPALDFFDDKEGKPEAINKYIGRKPVFAVGNSDGDLQMLRWTNSNSYTTFKLYVHHTDEKREWAYDRQSFVGRLNKGLDEAEKLDWSVVNMKKDWKVVFPFESNVNKEQNNL